MGKVSRKIGYIGAGYSVLSYTGKVLGGKPVTIADTFDTVLTVGLSVVAFSNPVALIAIGAYTVIDMYGGFDGIKEGLGMDKVIINK